MTGLRRNYSFEIDPELELELQQHRQLLQGDSKVNEYELEFDEKFLARDRDNSTSDQVEQNYELLLISAIFQTIIWWFCLMPEAAMHISGLCSRSRDS